jgi:hypothetical protein
MGENLPARTDPYAILDRLDEEAFVAEMSGAVVKHYVYKVMQWNPETRQKEPRHQLSKPGVDAVCRELAKRGEVIREELIECVEDNVRREAKFHVRATRYQIRERPDGSIQEIPLDSAFGVKRQSYNIVGPGGMPTDKPNPHWYEHGTMKAARNARRRLIPEAVAVELITAWAKAPERVREVAEPDDRIPPGEAVAPPSTRERAEGDAGAAKEKAAGLTRVRSTLQDLYGPGAPWDGEEKQALLKKAWGTANWKDITTKSPSNFLAGLAVFDHAVLTARGVVG